MECIVCLESYTKTKCRPISCCYCSYTACYQCTKHYLLDTFHAPHCMNCRKEWSNTFLSSHLSFFMQGEYRDKKETLLYEREKATIPSLLGEAEREKRIINYNKYIEQAQQELVNLYSTQIISVASTTKETFDQWKRNKNSLKRTIRALYEERSKQYEIPVERKTFVMRCTADDCRGFLSTRYKCGLCHKSVCSECHLVLEKDHACNPDTVASVQEVKKSTKSCPNCQTPIYKTEGCDQMWCIQCHTAFSWKTGLIEQGIIHNPHYFQYLKDKGEVARNALDVPCGGLPHYRYIYDYMLSHHCGLDATNYVRLKYEQFSHLRDYTLREMLPNPQVQINHNALTVDYILNRISEKNYKATLYVRERKRERGLEERQMLDAYVTIGEEAFRKLISEAITIDEFISEIQQIKWYTQNELNQLNHRYQHTGWVRPEDIN